MKRPPKDDQELMRDVDRRIRRLEQPSTARVGSWVVATDPGTGGLVATHQNGGGVRLANVPDGSNPDEVSTPDPARLEVVQEPPASMEPNVLYCVPDEVQP